MTEDYLTIEELSARLKIKPKTIKNKMAAGIFRKHSRRESGSSLNVPIHLPNDPKKCNGFAFERSIRKGHNDNGRETAEDSTKERSMPLALRAKDREPIRDM